MLTEEKSFLGRLEHLREAPGGLSRSEISGHVFGRNKPMEQIRRVLSILQQAGLAQQVRIGTNGRAREVWVSTGGTKETKDTK